MSITDSKNTSNRLYIRACVAGINAFTSSLQSCAIVSHFLPGPCVTTLAAVAKARSSSLPICDTARRSHSTPCEAACTRRSSNLAADADSSSSSYDVQLASNTLNRIPMVLHATISISTKQNHAIDIIRAQQKKTGSSHVNHGFQTHVKHTIHPCLRRGHQCIQQLAAKLRHREPIAVGSFPLHICSGSQSPKLLLANLRHSETKPLNTL